MTDVYRTSGYSCASCNAPLREFGTRLVCDECGAMLLAFDDFRSACADTAGTDLAIVAKQEKPSNKACPHCARTMTACDLAVGKLEFDDWLRCEQHGLWCSRDRLTEVFAKVARKYFGIGAANYFDAAGGHTRKVYPAGGTVGGAATDGLTIARWRDRPRKRAKTMTPINVYADQTLRCPACGGDRELAFMGDRWVCEGCHGLFVQTPALAALVEEMTGQPWRAPALVAGAPGTRACPVCSAAMTEEALDGVVLDACGEHGIWFDPKELETVLVSEDRMVHPGGIRGWLRRLF